MMAVSISLAQNPPAQRGTEQERPPGGPATGGQERNAGEARGGRGRGGQLGGQAAGFVQNPTIDKTIPELPADLKSGGVLIFSKTNGFREEASIQASNVALAVIAKQRGWPYFVTENGAIMNPDQLSKFKLVIWNNTSGDTLSEEQRAAFKTWVEAGGSFLGVHGAGGDPVTFPAPRTAAVWKWYVVTLLGAQFIGHSSIMPGDIHIEDTKSRITKGLPAIWHRSEEWFPKAREKSQVSTSSLLSMKRATRQETLRWAQIIPSSGGTVWGKAMHCILRSDTLERCTPSH